MKRQRFGADNGDEVVRSVIIYGDYLWCGGFNLYTAVTVANALG